MLTVLWEKNVFRKFFLPARLFETTSNIRNLRLVMYFYPFLPQGSSWSGVWFCIQKTLAEWIVENSTHTYTVSFTNKKIIESSFQSFQFAVRPCHWSPLPLFHENFVKVLKSKYVPIVIEPGSYITRSGKYSRTACCDCIFVKIKWQILPEKSNICME